jgi:hypothetical protein
MTAAIIQKQGEMTTEPTTIAPELTNRPLHRWQSAMERRPFGGCFCRRFLANT